MSLFMISREETIGGKRIVREKINWGPILLIVIGVIALAMIGTLVVSQFVFQGDETIRVSPMEERIGEKLAAGQALTAQEQAAFEKMKAEGVAAAKKFLQGEGEVAPVVSDVGLPPIKNTWKVGALTIVYRETASARGKINISIDKQTIYEENLLGVGVDVDQFTRITYRSGKVASEQWLDRSFGPKEKIPTVVNDQEFAGIATVEIWYENIR